MKIAFNAANAAVEVLVALLVFDWLGGAAGAAEPRAWVAAIAAGAVSGAVAAFAVTVVISVAEGARPERTMVSGALIAGPIAGLISVGGVICVGALSWNSWMGPPLLAAVLGAILVYRAYASLSGRHVSLERSATVQRGRGSSAERKTAAPDPVLRCRSSCARSGRRSRSSRPPPWTAASAVSIDHDGRSSVLRWTDTVHIDPLWVAALRSGESVLVERSTRSPDALEHLARRGLREAVITPLRRGRRCDRCRHVGKPEWATCARRPVRRAPLETLATPPVSPGRTAGSSRDCGTTPCTTR
jgi:hypothetical protein